MAIKKLILVLMLLTAVGWGQTLSGGGASMSSSGTPPPTPPIITSPIPPVQPVDGIQGQSYSQLFIACCGSLPYTWQLVGTLPPGTTFTTVGNNGVLSAVTLGIPGSSSFNIIVTDHNGSVASYAYTMHIVAATPPIFTTTIPPPDGVKNTPYSSTETFGGGTGPYNCSLSSGAYPTGLSLSTGLGNTCDLVGTPSAAATFTYKLRVTDSLLNFADTLTRNVIIQNAPPQIGNAIPPDGTTGDTLFFTATACCGTPGYLWSYLGTLPPGIILTQVGDNATLTGTYGLPGNYAFTLRVQDSNGLVGTHDYVLHVFAPLTGLASLPLRWQDSHECDGKWQHTLLFPADSLGMHGGVAYASTQAGVILAMKDMATQRDIDGTGTDLVLPANSPFVGTSVAGFPGPNTATGLNSTNCLAVLSSNPIDPSKGTACSGGTFPWTPRAPGCPVDKSHMWQWSQMNSANPAFTCNLPGTAGPVHHILLQDFMLEDNVAGPTNVDGVALLYCGTNNETTVAAMPNHMNFTRFYFHGSDSPRINALRGAFFAMSHYSFNYGYMEMIHGSKEGQGFACQQCEVGKYDHNFVEGGSEGSMIGGAPIKIPGFANLDFEFRGNRFTRDYNDINTSRCGLGTNYIVKNRFEIKNGSRALIKGNTFEQSWCDGQSGFLVLMNIRAESSPNLSGGNDSVITDINFLDNGLFHAAQGVQIDGSSGGTSNTGASGFGQAMKMRRIKFHNVVMADIGDFTRYPAITGFVPYTSAQFQVGASGQSLNCTVTRDATGTVDTAVCASQPNVPGTGMLTGDPVKMSGCGDPSFNVGTTIKGPPALSAAPNTLVITYANTGTANASTTCTLDNSAGFPDFLTIDHVTDFVASNSASWLIAEAQSPNFQYPQHNLFTNSIFASNGGNGGGISSNSRGEGTPTENMWDVATFHLSCNIFTGRNASLYTLYQTGECPNAFPGNNVGGANNKTGIVCSGPTPDASCLGATGQMNGVAYNSNPADYHDMMLRADSNWAAAGAAPANDGTDKGADFSAYDAAMASTLFVCDSPCGTGPYRDDAGVFAVPSAGDNVDGCRIDKPCDSFTALRSAVQKLPLGSKSIDFRQGTYRIAATIALTSTDSGNQHEDMLDWWCMDSRRLAFHMTGPGLYSGCWLDKDAHKFWTIKDIPGHPWDIFTYDNNFIKFFLTENGDEHAFTNASAWKRYQTPVALFPRFADIAQSYTFASAGPIGGANPITRTLNCETDGEPTIFIGSAYGFQEPVEIAHVWGGDVGTQDTVRADYFYSGDNSGVYNNRERYSLVKGWGPVQWDHATLVLGVYVVDQTSTHVTLTAGAVPAPSFPCGINFSWWPGGTPGSGGQATAAGQKVKSDVILWRSYPGETASLTGNKQVSGLVLTGTCGTNCNNYAVTQPAASFFNYESLWYNGARRLRPQATGSVHGYIANNCPTSTTDDTDLCKSGGGGHTLAQADIDCACPAAVTGAGLHCAGLQTKVCTIGGATPFQCFNKYKYNGTDISNAWHGRAYGDLEVLGYEDWDMFRMRLLSAGGGVALFTGATAQTNNHGCQGGHQYIVENVKENFGKGQWYLDRDPTNTGSVAANWTLNIGADTSIGEAPTSADIEIPGLDPASPYLISGTGLNYVTFQNMMFSGDNWQPKSTGLGETQMQPGVSGLLYFPNANHLTFDGDTIFQTTGWGIDFQGTATHNLIQNSHCYDIGGGCIRFGTSVVGQVNANSSDTDLNVPQYNTVFNNLIDHPGRIQPGGFGTGIALGDGHHNTFDHNEIQFPYTGGIELGFGLKIGADDGSTHQQWFIHDNMVSNNLIVGAPNALDDDFGLIYGATSYSTMCPAGTPLTGSPCNTFRNNVLKNAFGNYDLSAAATSSGARGLYLDQGSANNLVQQNLIVRTAHSGFFFNQPQIAGINHFQPQHNYANNNILAQCGYTNTGFTANLATACFAKNGQNEGAFDYQHNIAYMHSSTIFHFQNLVGQWGCFGAFYVQYNGAAGTVTITVSTTQLILTSSTGGESHTVNLAGLTVATLSAAINAFPNYLAGNTSTISAKSANSLAVVAATSIKTTFYSDQSINVICTGNFALANNDYFNTTGTHTLTFGTCQTAACTAPFNGTNFHQFNDTTGHIPLGWTNPWLADNSTAGEDVNSQSIDPGFVDPTCATDNWHYSHDFSGIGIVQWDYTTAGRLPGSPYTIGTVTEMFPVRPVNCLTDF